MDKSLSNFEISDNFKTGSDGSDHGSENLDIVSLGDNGDNSDQSSNNSNKDDFDSNLPETVTLLQHQPTGAKIYLVGTAHFSTESIDDVIKVIQNVLPNAVVLELCSSRTNMLSLDEKTVLEEAKNIDLQKIINNIKQSGLYNGLMYILLLNMSAQLTKQLGMAPGGEFRAAYNEAQKLNNCEILLGDRPLQITLQRALARLTWLQTMNLVWHLLTSKDTISAEEIEKCKKRDMLEQLLEELAGKYPAFREVFLNERDIYLTHSLQTAAFYRVKKNKASEEDNKNEPVKIVGVVGIGHVPGIVKLWPYEQKDFIKEIMIIPPPSITLKIIRISFRISLLSLGGYLVYKFIPIPRFLRENIHVFSHKMLSNLRTTTGLKYTIN